ncbi:ComF family protein [Ramlibacter sp. PS4R-6]|uniref:ComF family protein n=1 Tax=Ramlibacter sp. PS4R-6 TaxID=3133438 RepID=UPI0030A290D7
MFQRLLTRAERALPAQCAVCRAWPAQALCERCVERFAQPRTRCLRCALPVPPGVRECGACLGAPPPLDACHAAVAYDYPWSSLVAQFKFNGQAGWARSFALLMRSAPWVEPALEAAQAVVPMPLSRARLAERGFNQSLELAKALALARTNAGLLLRIRATAAQSALDRQARIANVKGAFAVDPLRAGDVRGKRVAIVDDVMTSGASMFAAAQALRDAGAAQVTGIVFARTDEPGA